MTDKRFETGGPVIVPSPDPRLVEMIVNAQLRLDARIDSVMDDVSESLANVPATADVDLHVFAKGSPVFSATVATVPRVHDVISFNGLEIIVAAVVWSFDSDMERAPHAGRLRGVRVNGEFL